MSIDITTLALAKEYTNRMVGSGGTGGGVNGKDGITPHIGDNGNWFIGTVDTGISAQGPAGENGVTPHIGTNGNWYIGSVNTGVSAKGAKGDNGLDGNGIKSAILNSDYTLTLTFDDGTTYTTPSIRGATGSSGKDGPAGAAGKDGTDGVGIASIEQTATSTADGGNNVFTVTLTNGTTATFTVKNGSKGSTGKDGSNGVDGGHYTPVVTQPTTDTMQISFAPSKSDMPAVNPVTVNLPVNENSGQNPCELPFIEQPTIYSMPKQCAVPKLVWSGLIQDDLSIGRAKPSLMAGNGNRWVITWGENLDGTTADLPTYTGTGTLAIKYRACWANGLTLDGTVADGVGTVAKKGDEYIDYTGATRALPGGCGLPSSVGISGTLGKAYFSSVEQGTTTINGTRQRLIPCCVDVTIGDANSVAFATPRELTLDINGEVGAFDMSRLGYDNWYTYYTTMAPTYLNSAYSWCQPVTDGFVYLTSADGINWVYKCKVSTPIQPRYEVAHAFRFGRWNARTVAVVRTAEHCLLVMLFDNSTGEVYRQYKLDDVGSRPMIYTGRDVATLLHTINTDRNQMEILQLKPNDADDITFYRWATLYATATWYPALANNRHNAGTNLSELLILGNNLGVSSGKGMSMVRLTLDAAKPRSVTDCVLDDPAASVNSAPELTDSMVSSLAALVAKLNADGTADAELAAFNAAWGITAATLVGISATYAGGNVNAGTALEDLKGITVSARYSDGSTKNVTDYTLSGKIVAGNNIITVAYGGFTTTFVVVGVGAEEPDNPPGDPILVLSGADMVPMQNTAYADGAFTIDADRAWAGYDSGLQKTDVCRFSEVDGKDITISFDWAIDPMYDNVGSILVNINNNTTGEPKRWTQWSVSGVAIGTDGNHTKTVNMTAGALTIGSGDVLPDDYVGVKVLYTMGKATISNVKIEIR